MSILTKDQIYAASDLPTEHVPVPEWGGELIVKTMTSAERDQWEEEWLIWRENVNGDRDAFRYYDAFLVSRTVVDESGGRMFIQEDVKKLADKSARVIGRLSEVARRLNFITAADVESAVKNSAAAPS